jgi:septum formation protein
MNQELICLASASPRRRQLLDQIGVACEVRPMDIDEFLLPDEPPHDFVRRLALSKAEQAAMSDPGPRRRLVLAADTVVVLDGKIFGKPSDDSDARDMLRALSGRTHEVMTAIAISDNGSCQCELSESKVTFCDLTPAQIDSYVATGEPAGKAGAYAIQGKAAVFIRRIEGSFSGVMGLPLFETAALLGRFGVDVMCPPARDADA